MKVLLYHSAKVILVRQNQIPLNKLLSPKYVEELRTRFHFGAATISQDPANKMSGVTYANGLFKTHDGKELAVPNLVIESRKITFQLEGTSSDADAFYADLKKFLFDLVDIEQPEFLIPVITVDETELVSELKFSIEKLFSSALYKYVAEDLLTKASDASNSLARARLGAMSANFQIDYEPVDFALLADSRININRKEFVIQVAPGYGTNDKVFATKAPLSTDAHLQLLQDLEEVFANS